MPFKLSCLCIRVWIIKNVCNSIGKVLSGWTAPSFSFCTYGDLLKCISDMVQYRTGRSVRVSKVKGHATDAMDSDGRVWKEDKDGNDAADVAADFGRLRQREAVIDARRNLLGIKTEWYPRILFLHRFMVAIARESLNCDDADGTVVDPL